MVQIYFIIEPYFLKEDSGGGEQHITGKIEIDSVDINYAKKLASFDYKYQHYTKPITYRGTFYTSQSNDMEISHTERYKKRIVKTIEFTIES